jgi:hypothetical protein
MAQFWYVRSVVVGSDIIALRKVPIQAADYAYEEYGLTPAQVEDAGRRITARIKRERRTGTIKEFKGDWRELRG